MVQGFEEMEKVYHFAVNTYPIVPFAAGFARQGTSLNRFKRRLILLILPVVYV